MEINMEEKALFSHGVWCVSRVQDLLRHPSSIAAFDVAKRYETGEATNEQLTKAHTSAKTAEEVVRLDYMDTFDRREELANKLTPKKIYAEVAELKARLYAAEAVKWLTSAGTDISEAVDRAARCAVMAVSSLARAKAADDSVSVKPAAAKTHSEPESLLTDVQRAWEHYGYTSGALEESEQKKELERLMERFNTDSQTESLDGFIANRDNDDNIFQPARNEVEQTLG